MLQRAVIETMNAKKMQMQIKVVKIMNKIKIIIVVAIILRVHHILNICEHLDEKVRLLLMAMMMMMMMIVKVMVFIKM